MSSTEIPLCIRDNSKPYFAQTFVAKVRAARGAVEWISVMTSTGHGAGAVAVVNLETDEPDLLYIVITRQAVRLKDYALSLTSKLEHLSAKVEWVRPFDRRLQRLFGWGDVWASRETLDKACETEDKATLLKACPKLWTSIEIGDIHDFAKNVAYAVKAPTQEALMDHRSVAAPTRRIEHELKNSHVFGEPSRKLECSLCDGLPAALCECGAQRCCECMARRPLAPHNVAWKQSSVSPEPFYVQELIKMRNEQKIEWLRDELPADASLEDFAQIYKQLFGHIMKNDWPMRLHCLELYCMFNPKFTARKECEVHPPEELETFRRVFDPSALARCRWCASAIRPGGAYDTYCSDLCHAAAHPPGRCVKCDAKDLELVQTLFTSSGNGMARCRVCRCTWYCNIIFTKYDPTTYYSSSSSSLEPPYKLRRRS